MVGIRELNRATLARQSLLERSSLGVVEAVERFGGLQAQEPASPYIALWTRLAGFEAADLDRGLRERRLVKATLMRSTLHVVSSADYLRLRSAVDAELQSLPVRDRYRDAGVADIEAVAEAALAFADRPRSNAEIHAHLAAFEGSGGLKGEDVWWRVRRYAPFVHVPDDHVPWAFGRRPRYVAARSWLAGRSFADAGTAVEHLVRRYLGAFGPATEADLRGWSHLPARSLRSVLERMHDVETVPSATDRDLLDLAGAPRPGADLLAPPRLLPMWDSVLLAHADRTRILPAVYRRAVIATNGDVMPTFLVDGMVAGLWWTTPARRGLDTRIVLEPFGRLARSDRRALETEAASLASFVAPLEPDVYARYRGRRGRDVGRGRSGRWVSRPSSGP